MNQEPLFAGTLVPSYPTCQLGTKLPSPDGWEGFETESSLYYRKKSIILGDSGLCESHLFPVLMEELWPVPLCGCPLFPWLL